ncbi:hypothetical protein YTPLAS18_31370 [Nitrospira sp.]|nr:hypothetical protein YTPLAS18_31370 [Nitrospira sp.]
MHDLISLNSLTEMQTEQLWRLYQGEWWSKGRSLSDVTTMLHNSGLVFGYAEPDGTLVAFARVLTDHLYRALLLDVIVAPRYRKRGLGAKLMRDILAHPVLAKVESIVLFCRPELVDFYRRCGFATSDTGIVSMRLRRTPYPHPPT